MADAGVDSGLNELVIGLQRHVGAELRTELAESEDADHASGAAEQKAKRANRLAWDLQNAIAVGPRQEPEKEYGRCGHRCQGPAFFATVCGARAQRVEIDSQDEGRDGSEGNQKDESGAGGDGEKCGEIVEAPAQSHRDEDGEEV